VQKATYVQNGAIGSSSALQRIQARSSVQLSNSTVAYRLSPSENNYNNIHDVTPIQSKQRKSSETRTKPGRNETKSKKRELA
jgi:hypothetical protein